MAITDKIEEIAEELRTTRYKKDNKMAFEYVYEKHKRFFDDKGGYDGFLRLMKICATFFASQGDKTKQIRESTTYKYV